MTQGYMERDGEVIGRIRFSRYTNGRVAVFVGPEREPYCVVSINVESVPLAPGEFVVNHDLKETDLDALLPHFIDTGKRVNYGFITDQPVWKVKED